jgi:hypothetical protein
MKRNHSFFSAKRRYKVTTLVKITLAYLGISSLPISGVAGPIKQIALDNYVIQRVPVATGKGNTVIMFPSPIQALYASRCAIQEQPNADFLLDFQAGQYWFTVRALKKDVEDYITVIYERKAYVIHITASETPLYTVSFFRDDRSASGGPSLTRRVTPARLISLLDKAKAYNLFLAQEPDAVAGVLYDRPARICDYPRFRVRIDEVFRFEEDDTVVFNVALENQTDQPIFYDPQGFAVQLKTNIYTASVVDASGVMPPQSTSVAFFAITGTPGGGRNNLAPQNNWNVLITEKKSDEAAARQRGGEGK